MYHNTIGVMKSLPISLFAVAFLAAHLETGRLINIEQCVYIWVVRAYIYVCVYVRVCACVCA